MPSRERVTSKQRVLFIDPSPMNPRRWCLTLECKHEVWLTSKSKPTRLFANCPLCAEKVRETLRALFVAQPIPEVKKGTIMTTQPAQPPMSIFEQDSGGNSTITRLDAELSCMRDKGDWSLVMDSSLTYGDLRLLRKFVKAMLGEVNTK